MSDMSEITGQVQKTVFEKLAEIGITLNTDFSSANPDDIYDLFRIRFAMGWNHDAKSDTTWPCLGIGDQEHILSAVVPDNTSFDQLMRGAQQLAISSTGKGFYTASYDELIQHSSWIIVHRINGLIQFVATCEINNTDASRKEDLVSTARFLTTTAQKIGTAMYCDNAAAENIVASAFSLIAHLPPGYASDALQIVREAEAAFHPLPLHAWPDDGHTECGKCGISRINYWRQHGASGSSAASDGETVLGDWFTPFAHLTEIPEEYDDAQVALIRCPNCKDADQNYGKGDRV